MASLGPGCTPDAPYADRRRSEFSHDICGKKPSSEMIHETLALGYHTLWKFVPKALFWSVRNAAVTNRRSLNPSASSAKKPSVFCSVVALAALGSAPEAGVWVPGGRFAPSPAFCLK